MKNEIFEKIKDFTIRESFIKNVVLTRETQIEQELGISGHDAVEFILAFSKEFNVDVSRFMAGDYFDDEGGQLMSQIKKIFSKNKTSKKKQITLGDLERAVTAGKLDETVIGRLVG